MSQPGQMVVVDLQYPFEFADDLIDKIELRRPKGKDIKACVKGVAPVAETMALAARLSGHLPAVFDEMDALDVTAVMEAVGNFMAPGR